MLECVVNVSEGRRLDLIDEIAATAGNDLLDLHSDAHHNRSVLTLVGESAPRAVARAAVVSLDLREHDGVHPRIGIVDVVPFVALEGSAPADAIAARDRFASWAADELGVPCFLYGTGRTLPEVRRDAFRTLRPDTGPATAHPTAGAIAVGARPVLVAYNVWLAAGGLAEARRIAVEVRGPSVRALGLQVGDGVQVSMNLVEPLVVGPDTAADLVVAAGGVIERCELVGLAPAQVVEAVPPERRAALDLDDDRTIEARLAARRARNAC